MDWWLVVLNKYDLTLSVQTCEYVDPEKTMDVTPATEAT